NQVFGPVWTVLYILMGIAAYLVWIRRDQTAAFNKARNIYFIQLFFNFCWSIIFFGLHQILAAFVIIVLLWISIIFNIFAFAKINKAASILLVPYLLWVSFAGVLNFAVYLLNR
ncbi:MAG: TspO/MBR family protein, partial [Mucilaginibacter sp.]